MHEYSVIDALLQLCEEHAKKEGATRIKRVNVAIGELSGVEPMLLESAFDTFKEGTICAQAEFVMERKKLMIHCGDCELDFTPDEPETLCPKCGSVMCDIISGKEMHLMSLEME